jgi:hypothetical protein
MDEFEAQLALKEDKTTVDVVQQKIDYWQTCFKNTLVVVHESLRMH